MTTTINTEDARDMRAVALLGGARSWLKCRVRLPDGLVVKAYGIPSASEPDTYRLTNLRRCSCPDFQFRQDGGDFRCAHIRAVRLYLDWLKAERLRQEARAAMQANGTVDAFTATVDAF